MGRWTRTRPASTVSAAFPHHFVFNATWRASTLPSSHLVRTFSNFNTSKIFEAYTTVQTLGLCMISLNIETSLLCSQGYINLIKKFNKNSNTLIYYNLK